MRLTEPIDTTNFLSFSNQNFEEKAPNSAHKEIQTESFMEDKSSNVKIPEKRLQELNLEIQLISSQLTESMKGREGNEMKRSKSSKIMDNLLDQIDKLNEKLDIRNEQIAHLTNKREEVMPQRIKQINFFADETPDKNLFTKELGEKTTQEIIEDDCYYLSPSAKKEGNCFEENKRSIKRIEKTAERIDYYGDKINDLIDRMDRLYDMNFNQEEEEIDIQDFSPKRERRIEACVKINNKRVYCSASSPEGKIEVNAGDLEKMVNKEITRYLGDKKIKIEIKYLGDSTSPSPKKNFPSGSTLKQSSFYEKEDIPPPRSKNKFKEKEISAIIDSDEFGIMVNEILEEGVMLSKEQMKRSKEKNKIGVSPIKNSYMFKTKEFQDIELYPSVNAFSDENKEFVTDGSPNNPAELKVYISKKKGNKGLTMDIYANSRTEDFRKTRDNLKNKIRERSKNKSPSNKVIRYNKEEEVKMPKPIIKVQKCENSSISNNSPQPPQQRRIIREVRNYGVEGSPYKSYSNSPSYYNTYQQNSTLSPSYVSPNVSPNGSKRVVKRVVIKHDPNFEQKEYTRLQNNPLNTHTSYPQTVLSISNPLECLLLFSNLHKSLIKLFTKNRDLMYGDNFKIKVEHNMKKLRSIIEIFLKKYFYIYKHIKNLIPKHEIGLDLEASLFNSKNSNLYDEIYLNKEADLILIHSKFIRKLYKENKSLKKVEALYLQSQNFERKNQKHFLFGIKDVLFGIIQNLGRATNEVVKAYMEGIGDIKKIKKSIDSGFTESLSSLHLANGNVDLANQFNMEDLSYFNFDWDEGKKIETKSKDKEIREDIIGTKKERNFEVTQGINIKSPHKESNIVYRDNFNVFKPELERRNREINSGERRVIYTEAPATYQRVSSPQRIISHQGIVNPESIGRRVYINYSPSNDEIQRLKNLSNQNLQKTRLIKDSIASVNDSNIPNNNVRVNKTIRKPPSFGFESQAHQFGAHNISNRSYRKYKNRKRIKLVKANGTITSMRLLSSNGNIAIGFNTGELLFCNLKNKEKIDQEKGSLKDNTKNHRKIEECSIAHKSAINSMEVMWVYFTQSTSKKNFMEGTTNSSKRNKMKNLVGMRKILLTGGSESECSILVWDLKTRKPVKRLSGHKHLISSIQDLGDYSHVATSSFDSKIAIWDIRNEFKCKRVIEFHQSPILCLKFSRKSQEIVVGYMDGTVGIWDVLFEDSNIPCSPISESEGDSVSSNHNIERTHIFKDIRSKSDFRLKSHIVKIDIYEKKVFVLGSNFMIDVFDFNGRRLYGFYSEFPVIDFVIDKQKNRNYDMKKTTHYEQNLRVKDNTGGDGEVKLISVDNRNNMLCYSLEKRVIGDVNYCDYFYENDGDFKVKAEVNNFFGCNPKTQIWNFKGVEGRKRVFLLKDEEKKNLIMQEFD